MRPTPATTSPIPDAVRLQASRLATACLIYALFIVYGSLVPLDFRPRTLADAWAAFQQIPYLRLGVASRADWVANILLYIPLAFFGTGAVTTATRSPVLRAIGTVFVAAACIALAFTLEFAQLFFPPRTVSQNDLIAESIGTLIGIALWLFAGARLSQLWHALGSGGVHTWQAFAALYTLAYLVYGLFPFDFLVSTAEFQQKLADPDRAAFIAATSCGPMLSCTVRLAVEIAVAAPLGALVGRAFPALGVRAALLIGLGLGLTIETLQILLASGISQGVSVVTRGLGMAWGLTLQRHLRLSWLVQYRGQIRLAMLVAAPAYLALLAHLNGFTGSIEPIDVALRKLDATQWLPFYYHYFTTETEAVASLLGNAGAYALVGFAAWLLWPKRRNRWFSGGVAVLLALGFETLRLFTPGEKPDPTNLLIAFVAAWLVSAGLERLGTRAPPARAHHRRHRGRLPPAIVLGSGFTLAMVLIGGIFLASPKLEKPVDESQLPQLPPGEELPEAVLPAFRFEHPRLPHPTIGDLIVLEAKSTAFLRETKQRAGGGRGDLFAAILQARLEPGSVDLDVLHRRLMDLRLEWRGHEQGKPLALAYDWLYDQWSSSQRLELLDYTIEACNYLITVIRKERMSPYNVYLYNSPFQALVACSLAVYGDDPRADPVMRFTDDYWKNRVLPVWRQIMGRNGGWHEGGEYIGIGIGQAVYQVPAMWRAATGEDYFATEPGIRGFLDFLVYRTQPDGTHFRWGDAGFFDRIVPDAIPLAIEFRHPAAYTLLRSPGKERRPTGWPWGPYTDPALHDPDAVSRLPLTRFFDGIGMVVARSDWTPAATYVTFKAGDNYWSHSHLDQGAFTIYKGGPLAIDSGFYGPGYGSDHHMNYSYQTVAHNTVTVTDPDDTVPAPGKEKPRPIANDGGQRRVGSGWGVEAAPLDLVEWRAKREIYHTGKVERLVEKDGLTIAVADVTPAYTNTDSGDGKFSDRTRRVERFWRTFAYDRVDDVVITFDSVVATEPSFRKRWLLHSIGEPRITPEGFRVHIPPGSRPGRSGGNLEAKVLLPRDASINLVGGRGLEFFVDDRNYDENGKVWKEVKNRPRPAPEPGEWRVEVSPYRDARDDTFLVVLLPTALGVKPEHRVRLLEDGVRVGCEIVGPERTTRWWFDPAVSGPIVEIVDSNGARQHDLRATAPPSR